MVVVRRHTGESWALAAPLLPFGTRLSTRGGRRGLGTTEPTILGLQV